MSSDEERKDLLMSDILFMLAVALMAMVAIVLVRGIFNMGRGGNANTSNKLMQARVVLQLLAIVIIVAILLLSGGGR